MPTSSRGSSSALARMRPSETSVDTSVVVVLDPDPLPLVTMPGPKNIDTPLPKSPKFEPEYALVVSEDAANSRA